MRILISGGYGYVGNFIAKHLAEFNHEIIIASRRQRTGSPFEFRPLKLDPNLDQRAVFQNIDVFIHAAFDHVSGQYRGGEGNDPDGFVEKNFKGTNALFKQAKEMGVSRVIFLSSRAVYDGQVEGSELFEQMHCQPDSLYGKIKLGSEQILQSLCDHQICGTSLRVTGVFGVPYDRAHPLNALYPDDPNFLAMHVQHLLENLRQGHKWVDLFTAYLAGEPVNPRAGTEIHGTELAKIIRLLLTVAPNRVNGESFNVSQFMLDRHDLLAQVQHQTGAQHALPPRADISQFNQMNLDKLMQIFS